MFLTGAAWINDKGEIVTRGVRMGCGDADICGHAVLLLPCDENHPGIEGCDYSVAEVADEPSRTHDRFLDASPKSPAVLFQRRNRFHFQPSGIKQ